jgi:hypothetical protein
LYINQSQYPQIQPLELAVLLLINCPFWFSASAAKDENTSWRDWLTNNPIPDLIRNPEEPVLLDTGSRIAVRDRFRRYGQNSIFGTIK